MPAEEFPERSVLASKGRRKEGGEKEQASSNNSPRDDISITPYKVSPSTDISPIFNGYLSVLRRARH